MTESVGNETIGVFCLVIGTDWMFSLDTTKRLCRLCLHILLQKLTFDGKCQICLSTLSKLTTGNALDYCGTKIIQIFSMIVCWHHLLFQFSNFEFPNLVNLP
jgi:hypothetical protein